MANNLQIATEVLKAVGGKENVSNVTHCMTRLRFNLKDGTVVKDEVVAAIEGVIKVMRSGGQYQVVIGTNVDKVYDELLKIGGFKELEKVTEEETKKGKLTVKNVFNGIMGGISGSVTPVLPVIIAGGIFKMIAVLFGPRNFGLLTEQNQLYILCNLVNDAAFYFLPFFVAHSAAKKFHTSPMLAMLLVGVMIHPDMLSIVDAGESFKIYNLIPMKLVNYTQAVIPVILNTWVMSKVESFVKKIVPDALRTIGVPVLQMVIMLPLGLCIFGPACNVVMGWVANGIIWLDSTAGVVAMVLVGGLWAIMIMFGVHMPIMMTLLPVWMEMGYDAIVSPSTIASAWGVIGVELAYALRSEGKENKSLGWSCFVTNITANISEPAIYGILLRDRKAMIWNMIGGAAGALVMGILGAKIVMFSGVGLPFLNVLRFGEDALKGGIGMAVAFVISLVLGIIFGFEGNGKISKKRTEETKNSAE